MQEKPKRKSIPLFKKLLFLLILFCLIAAAGIWYANEHILPTKGKALVVEYIIKATGREVALESIYYNPLRGITLKNLSISDDPKYNRKFLEIKNLYFNVLYLPLFKEKKLIIPSIRIDSPKIILTVDNRNKWNFESLLFLGQPTAKKKMDVLVNGLFISNATLTFEDYATDPVFIKEFKDMDINAAISYPLKIKYRLSAELDIARKNSISADGEVNLLKNNISLNLRLKDVPLAEFRPYYKGLLFEPSAGDMTGNISASYLPEDSVTFASISTITGLNLIGGDSATKVDLDLSGKMVVDLKDKSKAPCVISAAIKTADCDFTAPDFRVKGAVAVNGKASFDLKDKTVPLKYSADALFADAKIDGVPVLETVDKINGKLYIDETKTWADSIKGQIRGLDCLFEGCLKDYTKPYLTLTAKTDLDLNNLGEFLTPQLREGLKNYRLSGTSKIVLNLSGSPSEKTPLVYVLTADLLDCNVKPEFTQTPITSINGTLTAKENHLNIKDLSALFNGKKYTLKGDITNFKAPSYKLALASDDLNLKTDFTTPKKELNFTKFEGNYKNVKFNLFGVVSDFKDPLVDIHGSVDTDIDELKNYLPKGSVEFLNNLELKGDLSAKFVLKGRQKDPNTWQIDLIGQSPRLEVKKLKFDECYIEYKLKDNFISIPKITARPYGGALSANAVVDCAKQKPDYALEVNIKGIDISKWKNDTGLKDKDISGLFYGSAQFGGRLQSIDTLSGGGQFAIANGKLWELPVFAGLAAILYIPGVDKIIFKEAKGSFTVGNRVIHTEKTELYASQMSLISAGGLDFDGNLSFDITATFDKGLLEEPTVLGPLRDFLVDESGNFIGEMTLSGTLKEPKFKMNPFPLDKILKNKLMDNLRKKIFGGDPE